MTTIYAGELDDNSDKYDSSTDKKKDHTPVYHIYDDVDLVSTIKFEYGKPKISIKSVFPQLESDEDDDSINHFNQLVQDSTKEEITKFRDQVKENKSIQNKVSRALSKNNLFIDYDTSIIKSNGDHIISVRFSLQSYIAGMNRPNHTHRTFNYNLDTNLPIELNELFNPDSDYLNVLSDYTREVLLKRLANKEMVINGTAPEADNFKNWNIKPTGILITFDEHQVAPYINGAQTVLVPYGALKTILAEDSPIAGCVKHKRKCIQSNISTGGFMDEAANHIKQPMFSKMKKVFSQATVIASY